MSLSAALQWPHTGLAAAATDKISQYSQNKMFTEDEHENLNFDYSHITYDLDASLDSDFI